MKRLGRIVGILGFVALLSVPLTLFLWNWRLTWVAFAKLVFGLLALGFWLLTNYHRLKETLRGRSLFYGSFGGLFAAIALASVVFINYIAHHNPQRWDLTEKKVFSLAKQSVEILRTLEDDVEVLAFYGPRDPDFPALRSCLEMYRYASRHFTYRLIDPVERQDLVERYAIRRGGPRIVIRHGQRLSRVKPGGRRNISCEEAVTSALARIVVKSSEDRICLTTGHGEKGAADAEEDESLSLLARDLEAFGYRPSELSLLESARVPPDCRLVMLVGPRRDLTADEIESLAGYLAAGGRLMVFVGYAESDSLSELLAGYGIELGKGPVVTPHGQRQQYVTTDPRHYPAGHLIFSHLRTGSGALRRLQAVLPFSRPVRRSDTCPQNTELVELAATADDAWEERDILEPGEQATFDEGVDQPGPVGLAAVAIRAPPEGEEGAGSRLAVFGSSRMASDSAYGLYPFNRNLVMNTLAWLVEEESKITIRPRYRSASLLLLDGAQMQFIAFFSTDILPLLILAAGLIIWQLRRWS